MLIEPLPLTPLENFLLQCETPESPMVIEVILRFAGTCQPELFELSLQRAIERHRLLSCRIRKVNRKWCWVTGTPAQVSISRHSGSVFELESGTRKKVIDLTTLAGFQASFSIFDDGVRAYLHVHHAVCDGNGIRQLITDWLRLYHSEVTGTPVILAKPDHDRMQMRDQFSQPASIDPVSLKDAIRNFLTTIRGRTAQWTPLNDGVRSPAEAYASHCVEVTLSDQQGRQLRERLTAWKIHINDLVLVCSMCIFARLATPGPMHHRVTVFNPVDLRRPSDRDLPAVNRFGVAFIRRQRSDCLEPVSILRGIQSEMQYVRSKYIGVEFIRGLATASRIPGGIAFFRRLNWCIPSFQATCLGDMTRGLRRRVPWQDGFPLAGNLRWESTTGFAPYAQGVPITISTCENNQRMALAIQSSPISLRMDQTQVFAEALVEQLCTFPMPCETDLPQQGDETDLNKASVTGATTEENDAGPSQ